MSLAIIIHRFAGLQPVATKKQRQRGMTAVELGAVIAGGLLFLAAATYGVLRSLDNQKYGALTQTIAADMPSILFNQYATNGTLAQLTTAKGKDIIVGGGANSATPWGGSWAIQTAGAASTVTIRFPIGGGQGTTKGPTLAATLPTQYPVISAATYASGNLDISYNLQN